jgi:hypothetical protein
MCLHNVYVISRQEGWLSVPTNYVSFFPFLYYDLFHYYLYLWIFTFFMFVL